jgi:hypothetical protein
MNDETRDLMFPLVTEYCTKDEVDYEAFHRIMLKILPKKGDLSNPNKHRGIALQEVMSKIVSCMINHRLSRYLESFAREEQNGFRPGRGTADGNATLKMTLQTLREHGKDAYVLFLDLVKAFDTVNREMLIQILEKYGVPRTISKIIRKLYTDVFIEFNFEGIKKAFESKSGVKQGDVLAPTLFLYVMQAVFDSLDRIWSIKMPELRWRPPTSEGEPRGQLTSANWRNKGDTFSIRDILYADDAAGIFLTRSDLFDASELICGHFGKFGLTVHTGTTSKRPNSESKTVAMFFKGAGSNTAQDQATADLELSNDRFIPFVDEFCYLGCFITPDLTDDREIRHRLRLAKGAKARLDKPILRNQRLSMKTKMTAVRNLVLSLLLYDSENWAATRDHYKELEVFYNDCLRASLNTNRYMAHFIGHKTKEDLRTECEVHSLETSIHLRRARWLEKIARMPTDRPQRKLITAWINSPRPTGRPQTTTRATFAKTLGNLFDIELFNGDLATWVPTARQPAVWGKLVEQSLGLEENSYRRLRPLNESG